jgi:hypothetical protein
MTVQIKPLSEVNHQAIQVLTEEMGLADTLRFVNQFTTGYGNYTEEREGLLGHLTLDELVSAIENKRLSNKPPN